MSNTGFEIKRLIEASERIVITSHRSPDGDSIGSSAGLYYYLKKLGKKPVICHPDVAPEFINWAMPDNHLLYDDNKEAVIKALQEADLIFCLDYNDPTRMGDDMADLLLSSQAKKVMIDHHLFPKEFANVTISRTDVCSTSQLVFMLIRDVESSDFIDATIGTPLYLGIMTDTGSFRFSSVTAETHDILGQMIRAGVKHSDIHERVYDNVPLRRIRIRSYAISEKLEILDRYGIAIVSLNMEEFDKFDHQKGDTEGLVNTALAIEGIRVAVYLREHNDRKTIRLSFRSRPDFPVNEIAMKEFNGGGHKNASGGQYAGTIEAAIAQLKMKIPAYFNEI